MAREVIVILGAGGIGEAIARRQGAGRTVLLADNNAEVLETARSRMENSGYEVEAQVVDVTARASVEALANRANELGAVALMVNTAGLSPNMAAPDKVLAVDLYGVALVFDVFEPVIAPGGSGIVISSMAGHMPAHLPREEEDLLAFTPTEELLSLPMLQADRVPDSMVAYGLAKHANHLRVQAACLTWGERGARVNSVSPGIISTPLARHEFDSPSGPIYRAMIAASPAKRLAPAEEVANAVAWLSGPEASFVTGSDLLIDGGVIAAMRAGRMENPV